MSSSPYRLKIIKYFKIVLILCFLFVTLTGCNSELYTSNRVMAPKNNKIPIEGKWKVVSVKKGDSKKYMDKYAQFTKNALLIGEDYFINPSYKVKNVGVQEYLFYNMDMNSDEQITGKSSLSVVTISSENKFLIELAIINDNELIGKIDDAVVCFKKMSNKVDNKLYKKSKRIEEKNLDNVEVQDGDKKNKAGVLLGIKYEKSTDSNGFIEYGYRTFWIAKSEGAVHPVMQMDNILLPRKNAFWKVTVDRVNEINVQEDVIKAFSLNEKNNKVQRNSKVVKLPNIIKNEGIYLNNIEFIGNDYISMESIKKTENKYGNINVDRRLITEPIESINLQKGVKLSDICGVESVKKLEKLRRDETASLGITPDSLIDEQDFCIARKTGHWYLKGRINYTQSDGYKYYDYNINVKIPPKVVFYDTLCIPWTDIKDKVPDATDAITSTKGDMAIITAPGRLLVYGISNGKLSISPLKKVSIDNKYSVVMAEWCNDSYADMWENTFKKENFKYVDEN